MTEQQEIEQNQAEQPQDQGQGAQSAQAQGAQAAPQAQPPKGWRANFVNGCFSFSDLAREKFRQSRALQIIMTIIAAGILFATAWDLFVTRA